MKAYWRWVARGSLCAAVMGATACASRAESEPVASAQGAVSEDPPEVAHVRLVQEALAKVSLRADQKSAVDALVAKVSAAHAPIVQARLALREAVANQVKAGTVDRAALKPESDALIAAVEQARPAVRDSIVKLHDLLDPAQRNQLVDAIESQFREQHHGHPGMQRMHKWATDLNLTDAQREQIHTVMRAKMAGGPSGAAGKEQWHGAREHGRKVLESFRQDQLTLDASASFGPDKIEEHIGKVLDFTEAVLPILTPEQRAIAAQKIRTTHEGM